MSFSSPAIPFGCLASSTCSLTTIVLWLQVYARSLRYLDVLSKEVACAGGGDFPALLIPSIDPFRKSAFPRCAEPNPTL